MITVVIPARMTSSRFPGKPLISIEGIPMVEHVRRRAILAQSVDLVVVATCDDVIKTTVEAFGGQAVMTKDTHDRCTDRVEEAMLHLPGDIVVMVQGDEPLLIPDTISQVVQPLLDDETLNVVNLLSILESANDYTNPDIVKAICNRKGDVIYLTRGAVPVFKKEVEVPVYRQTGIMAFRSGFLSKYSQLEVSSLEIAESIDMLRVIEHGIRLGSVITSLSMIGVDRPEDVGMVESVLEKDIMQYELLNRIRK